LSAEVAQFEWFGLHKLLRRVTLQGVVTNVEPLRVGAGRVSEAFGPTDLVVVRVRMPDGSEVPLIPGSSWKGAIRAYATKLMMGSGLNVCDGLSGSSCLRGNEFERLERGKASHEEVLRAIASGEIKLCLACLIFGSSGFSSHIRFYDSYPIGSYKIGYRTMVAIDRRTGAARKGALFTVEYVEPGAEFSFKADFINLPNYAIGAVAEALLDMDMGLLKIGGLKTRGFGWVKIKDLQIEVYDYSSGKRLDGEVPPLDPFDTPVKLGSGWRQTLEAFANAWRDSLDKLRKVSEAGWRWLQ